MILKELREQLTGLRFLLSLVLTAVLFAVGTIISGSQILRQSEEFQDLRNRNLRALSGAAADLSDLANLGQTLALKPNRLEIAADAGLANVPTAFRVFAFGISEPISISTANPYVKRFRNVDWTFIIALLLSFLAVLATYDAVSGEKFGGTLRLVLSHPVARTTVIAGKYLSALIGVAIPLVGGTAFSLILGMATGWLRLSGSWIGALAAFMTGALAYLSIYVLLGLLVSSLTHHPGTSIMALLFVWVLFAILLPSSGGKIAAKLYPIPTREQITLRIAERQKEMREEHLRRNPQALSWSGDIWNPNRRARADLFKAEMEERLSLNDEFMLLRIDQVRRAERLLHVSPTAIFQTLAAEIFRTGLARYEHFYRQVVAYRRRLLGFIVDQDARDPGVPHLIYDGDAGTTMSHKSVPAEEIPRFEELELGLKDVWKTASLHFGLLLVLNGVLFLGVRTAFSRYDVR